MLNIGPPSDATKRRLPVELLYGADEQTIHAITRIQKLVFLSQEGDLLGMESLPETSQFEFSPRRYGPYSAELNDWLDRLQRQGVITVDHTESAAGNPIEVYAIDSLDNGPPDLSEVGGAQNQRAVKTIEEFNSLPILHLIDRVYEEYPQYR